MSKREDWMLGDDLPFDFDSLDKKVNKKLSEAEAEKLRKAEIASERELNPLLKKNAGIESSETSSKLNEKKAPSTHSIEWTTVLVRRAIKMIESGDKTYENAAVDRFGSIKEFEDAIRQVERHTRTRIRISVPSSVKAKPSVCIETKSEFPSIENKSLPQQEMTKEDINKLIAKKMKAEMAGDYETSRKIEEQIQKQGQIKSKEKEKLTLLPSEVYSKRRADDEMTIAEMVKHERLTTSKEFDREIERSISGNKKFKDDLDSLDEQLDRSISNSTTASSSSKTFDCRAQSIEHYSKRENIMKKCHNCTEFERPSRSSFVIAQGNFTYLAMPRKKMLHPLHCQIIPKFHVCSLLDCSEFEEEIWEEVRNFKKCLLQMAAEQNRSFVFIECVPRTDDVYRHSWIDCVPTPRGSFAEHVRGHFFKALQETDEEWSQNRKIIDTALKPGGLRAALPRRRFPYFYVDFRLDQGYAHVIEDSDKFGGSDFGLEIMASLLRVPRAEWQAARSTSSEIKDFAAQFKQFDWTKQLHVE
jgi:hypothetical protein